MDFAFREAVQNCLKEVLECSQSTAFISVIIILFQVGKLGNEELVTLHIDILFVWTKVF